MADNRRTKAQAALDNYFKVEKDDTEVEKRKKTKLKRAKVFRPDNSETFVQGQESVPVIGPN